MTSATGTPALSSVLADYVTATQWEDIPPEVIHRSKFSVLDTVGCMIAGSLTPQGERVLDHALALGTGGRSSLFGRPGQVDPERAVLANGTLAHALELDDGHRPSDNHLGCVIVPSAIAMAEALGSSGRDLLMAVVLGYDVIGRVGETVCLPRLQTPFHHTGTTAPFGAAAAAGRLLGLDSGQMANALGIAGTSGAGLREVFISGSDCKSLHSGRGCSNGLTAAMLARSGYEGPVEIFEGMHGFCTAFTPEPRPELAIDGLGKRFAVSESGFKVHAVCGLLFTPIDATLALREEHGIDPATVTSIRVALPGWVKTDPVFTLTRPEKVGIARFSVPFGVAAALLDGEVTPRQIAQDRLTDEALADLESKVEFFSDPEVEAIFEATKTDQFFFYPSRVEITSPAGTVGRLERTPVGYDTNRDLSEQQLLAKFRGLVEPVLGVAAADAVIAWAMGLDTTTDAAGLAPALAATN